MPVVEVSKEYAYELAAEWRAEGYAVAWTVGNEGDDAKVVRKRGWEKTPPVEGSEGSLAGLIATRLPKSNPVCVARPSGLIVFDCDSPEDVSHFKSFDPPITRSVYTSKARHFYYRQPKDWDERYSGIYFEGGAITPKTNCYVVMPPAIHATGHRYEWVNSGIPIAELPMDVYLKMVGEAEEVAAETDKTLTVNPDAVIPEGQRHQRLLSMLGNARRNGASYEAALALALDLNKHRFASPKPKKVIERVVQDVYKRYDPEGLEAAPDEDDPRRLRWRELSSLTRKSIEFADKPILQWGAFHVLAGHGEVGKGAWCVWLAAKISRGELEGQNGQPGRTYFVSSEDDAEKDLIPRLDAAGADTKYCREILGSFKLPEDAGFLRALVEDDPLCRAIIIDPVSNHLGSRDGNSETEVRDALAFLNDFAADNNIIVLGVRHARKDGSAGGRAAILGSVAWSDLPRAVLVMAEDNINESLVHLNLVKGNRSNKEGGMRVYERRGVQFEDLKESVVCLEESLEEPKNVDLLLATPSKKNMAQSLILSILGNAPAGMNADEVKEEVAAEVDCGKSTVYNAFKSLERGGRVKAVRSGFADEGEVTWVLNHDFGAVADW